MALSPTILKEVLELSIEARTELAQQLLRTLPEAPVNLARSSMQMAAVAEPASELGSWQGGQFALDQE
jgi:hypothetical protein